MDFKQKVYQMLEHDEGKKNKPYRDSVGKLTIGIGRNLDDVGLSDDEIYYLLDSDIRSAEKTARELFPEYDTYSEEQRLALINMAFNLGKSRLAGFHNTIGLIKKGHWALARTNALLSKWAKQVKSRSTRVTDLFLNKVTGYKFSLSKTNKKE